MVKQVLNYHDVQLYDSDVRLFDTIQWLNDNAINFFFQYLYHTVCLPSSASVTSNVLLVDPAIVSCMMLQCDDDDEYADLGRGLRVHEKSLYLLPVNDNQSFDSGSSHWSLLVYERQRFVHYDSSAGHNTTAAKKIARTFLQLLSASGVDNVPTWSSDLFANDRNAPQQQNGYDCGMYVLTIAEFLCRRRCLRGEDDSTSLREYVTADRVTALRLEIPRIVQRLEGDPASALLTTITVGAIGIEPRSNAAIAAKGMMIPSKAEVAVTSDAAGTAKPRAGLLDTRSYQELEPLQLPSKLRDRITKAQRRAAAEKDGISIFTSNVASTSLSMDDRDVARPGSRTKDGGVGASGREDGPRRRVSQLELVGADATPEVVTSKEKMHLPDVIISHKMREFEAKMNVNAFFVDPLENNLHHLSIDDKERVMLRMQEKIQAITAQIETHFVQIKKELDTHGIFDSAANTQRAQALCLVELQKRCKLERLRDEAIREVLDENCATSHAAMSEMEGKLNDLLVHKHRTSREQVDTSAHLAFSRLQKGTKSSTLKRRPGLFKPKLSPVKRKQPLARASNQLSHDVNASVATGPAHADCIADTNLTTSAVSAISPTEDWTSRHPHIVHVLQQLTISGGVSGLSTAANDTLDSFSSRLDTDNPDSTPMSLADEWFERSSSYQIIANRALLELQQHWARWRWDSTRHFHALGNNPFNSAEIVLPDALQRRLQQQRETATARLRDEDERRRQAASEESTAYKRERAEAVYQKLRDGIQTRRQEREKRSQCATKRVSTANSKTRASSGSFPERLPVDKRAVTADGWNLYSKPSKSVLGKAGSANASNGHKEKLCDGSDVGDAEMAPTRGALGMSASAPLLGRGDSKNIVEDASLRVDSRMFRDPKLPMLPRQRARRSRVRGDSLIGGRNFLDLNTLGHFSNSRMEERRDSAQTWAWHHPQTKGRSGRTQLVAHDERSDGEDDDDDEDQESGVDASERRDGMGAITSGDDEANDGGDVYGDSDGDSDEDDRRSGDDARSVRSSVSSRHLMDSARSSFSVMSKNAGHDHSAHIGRDGSGTRQRSKGKPIRSPKRKGSRGHYGSSPSKRASATVRGPRGSRLTSRTSNSSNVSGSSGGMFAGIQFTANAQVLQHRLEELWCALDFPFSSKLIMLEKYANLEDADALSRALTHWETAAEMVVLREKLKHIQAEFEELKDLKASSRLAPAEWSYLLMQQIEIPPNAINLSPKDLVEWTQIHLDAVTHRCEKMAQQVKANTGDELIFQGHRYPPRV